VALVAWLAHNQIDKHRWNSFVNKLDAETGIIITHSERRDGHYIVRGLKDPLTLLSAYSTARGQPAIGWSGADYQWS